MKQGQSLPFSMQSEPPHVQETYLRLLRAGQSPSMAEILACRQAPGVDSDTSHYAGLSLSQMAGAVGIDYVNKITKEAKAAGIAISGNSHFNSSVADKRRGADPDAWRHAGDGRDKYRNVLKKRGGGCDTLGVAHNNSLVGERMAKTQEMLNKRKDRRLEMSKGVVTQ